MDSHRQELTTIDSERSDFCVGIRTEVAPAFEKRSTSKVADRVVRARPGQGWPDTARAGSPEHFPFSAGTGSFGRNNRFVYAARAAAACHAGLAGMGWRAPRVRAVFRGGSRRYFFLMAAATPSVRWYLTSRIRCSSRSSWHRGPWSRISAAISVSSFQSCHSPIASFTSPRLVMNSC